MYKLLKYMEKIKGIPVVMNTSFNDKDEPIVCTPKDALKCFYGTAMDALVVGPYVVEKSVRVDRHHAHHSPSE